MTQASPHGSPTGPPEIAILVYPGAQAAAVQGLTDLFLVADLLARERRETAPEAGPLLRVTHLARAEEGEEPGACGARRVFDTAPEARRNPAPAVVILPPSLGEPPTAETLGGLMEHLARSHAAGSALASVCAGAFGLAETGLLDGRRATTHWIYAERFAARYPKIRVEAERLLIDDGDVITAGGLMSWTDLGLRLVERLLGSAAMRETARFLLVDPPGREQAPYSAFAPRLDHGDAAILGVQRWLRRPEAREADVAAMSARAGLETRTFLRRFRKATGLRPTEYRQRLRVEEARESLEATARPIAQIAHEVGYEDAGAFRRVFARMTGLAPGDYRKRFGRAG
ncbi:GlxA family transcriptional regulator [Neomegalonema sp.]|uniref:GlxA family transcriptional regulator n=1 Tax=Neomegalonema sp. TaxID=2039713 RepID=UPI00263984FF|nr:helix-turn-helix domain-containing protein [Neomegalonema sp.]MDD2867880.1 helix-turn-helix domain-containing protein [Neomegalonema sp.]